MDTTTRPLSSIGIDIGKEVFHVVGFGTDGKITFRRKIKRLALVETFRRLPPSIVGMENHLIMPVSWSEAPQT
jgi:transposase